jgi:hypothetical protein
LFEKGDSILGRKLMEKMKKPSANLLMSCQTVGAFAHVLRTAKKEDIQNQETIKLFKKFFSF